MRLVDLHCDWLGQYATETTQHAASLYPEVPGRVGRLDGYLLGCSLAVLAIARKPADWAGQPDPWGSLGLMIARCEAEFAGRILRDPVDADRCRELPADEMCWGVLGVAGFDFLVRSPDDLDRLPSLFERGIRVFQPVAAAEGVLGGSTAPGDDRGLTDLGRAFLDRLAGMIVEESRPRPILDLAGMSATTLADVLRWHEGPGSGMPIAITHGTADYRSLLDESSPEARNLIDFRALGGVIGLTPGLPGSETPDDLKRLIDAIAAVPFEGQPGHEGIAIGSGLMSVEHPPTGLASAREIARWIGQAFYRPTVSAIAAGSARGLLLRSAGADSGGS